MPRYDYRCTACGHVYEKQEGFDAPAQQECPQCAGLARRVPVTPAIIFKGSGWYATDHRKSTVEGGAASTKEGDASSTKSETKPESDSSPKSPESSPAPAATTEKAS